MGFKSYNLSIIMKINIPDISKQIHREEILSVLENKYSTMGPMWVTHQMEWSNGAYSCFKDHDKYLIVIFLIKKTLDFYSRNFIKLSYDEFYLKNTVETEKFSVMEISKELKIPKESARRKLLELENDGTIRRAKSKIIIDRSKFHYSKPENTIVRLSRFLSALSSMCVSDKILLKKVTSENIELAIKENFTYVWKIYYDIQIPMMVAYKKIFKDLETFHIYGTCVLNQHIYARELSKDYSHKVKFIESLVTKKMQGINAMSISDITSIPRATVIRKLHKLVDKSFLKIDNKKHYRLTGNFTKVLMPLQNTVLNKLANFSSQILNLELLNNSLHKKLNKKKEILTDIRKSV